MGFSSDAKSEILRVPFEEECCARAEMNAFVLLSGSISLKNFRRYSLSLSSENAALVRYAFAQMRKFVGLTPALRTVKSQQLGEHVRYQLFMEGDEAVKLLSWLDLMDDQAFLGIRREPSEWILQGECCRKAYLRGAFLTTGWVNLPDRAYHLEFSLQDERQAELISGLMAAFDIHARTTLRKGHPVVYVKDHESVAQVLGLLGAFQAYMALENTHILKELHNSVNRQMNCDETNISKTVRAAAEQMEDIEYLRAHGALKSLPRPLREIAEARMNNPDANLTELGELLDPPIGKSGVNNRLRRLSSMAQRLRETQSEP